MNVGAPCSSIIAITFNRPRFEVKVEFYVEASLKLWSEIAYHKNIDTVIIFLEIEILSDVFIVKNS
jgi:hypothetical protein